MSHEIYYTSAPEGMKRGTSGFCTVAASDNIPKALWDRLETLSAYRHVGGGVANPVSFAHWILTVTGKTHHVLSRICDSGVDHTQRTNAFAHHIVLDADEIEVALGGPAWMLEQGGVMAERWDGRVGALTRARLPRGDIFSSSRVCHAWAAATGDAGWGGHLADLFAKSPTRPVCILFAPGQEIMPLIAEAVALLPPAARWNVTFNTYFTSMPTSATCLWRCCLVGSQAADVGLRYAANGLVLNLADRTRLPALPNGQYVSMARTGAAVDVPRPAIAKPAPPKPTAPEAPGRAKFAAPPPPAMDEEDLADEQRRESIFDFANDPAAATPPPAPAPPIDPDDGGYSIVLEPRPRGRGKQETQLPSRMIRRADEALEEVEREAERAAQRRRKQVVMLFLLAVGAIGIGTGLIIYTTRNSAPPEPPPVTSHPIPKVDPQPVPDTTTVIDPGPVIPATDTAPKVADTRPLESQPVAPVPVAVVYPDVLTTSVALERPNIGTGIGDRNQLIPIRAADLDPARVTGLRMVLPSGQKGAAAVSSNTVTYQSEGLGTLTGQSETRAGKPGVTLRWKAVGESGSPAEVGVIAWDATKSSLDLQWHSAILLKYPGMFNLVYWLLQGGSLELQSPRETKQRIVFKPFAAPALNFTGATLDLPWPVELPGDTVVVPPAVADLPAGWQVDRYFDWSVKDPAARKPENALQVIKFKKAGGIGIADAIFTITFRAGMGKADSTFTTQLQEHENDLKRFESELRAIDKATDDPKQQEKRPETVALIDAYKNALAGYNELTKFDVSFEMPDGVRLATVHLQRPSKDQGK